MVELAIQYDTIDDLCPSPSLHYNNYILEVSVCSVMNLNSTQCDVDDITSISTLYHHTISVTESPVPSQRRLIRSTNWNSASVGFEIYVLMVIYAQDEAALLWIKQEINRSDFAAKVDAQWKGGEFGDVSDSGDSIGEIVTISTEDSIIPPTAQPAISISIAPTSSPISSASVTDTGYVGVVETQQTDGVLGVGASIVIVVGSALILAFCLVITRCCCLYNPKHLELDEDASQSEGFPTEDERDLMPISIEREVMDRINEVSGLSNGSRALRGGSDEENVLLQETDEEETGQISPLPELDQVLQHQQLHHVVEVNEERSREREETEALQNVLSLNGIAEFESSTSGMRALPDPVTPGAQYKELISREKFLSRVELQLNEIQIHTESIDALQGELSTLNSGIRNVLSNAGYEMPVGLEPVSSGNDATSQCMEYARYLNSVISQYAEEVSRALQLELSGTVGGGGDDDEMDFAELQERRRLLLAEAKRSSRKVSKTYVHLQHTVHRTSRSRSGSSSSGRRLGRGHGHGRGKSRDLLSDDTASLMSGISEAEKELEATNDNDVMKQYVLGSMDHISRIHGKKTDDILRSMPDSPSISAVSNLSNVNPSSIPMAVPVESALLAPSDGARSNKSSARKRRRAKISTKGHQARASTEEIPFNDHDDGSYDMEQLIRFNDPGPKHAEKKYDGFVPKAVTRMNTTGYLPTPSQSERDVVTDSAFHFAVTESDGVDTDHHYDSNGNTSGLPRPPPVPSDYVVDHIEIDHDRNQHDHDHDEDESLKRLAEAAGYALPYEAPGPIVLEDGDRDRGFSGYSMTTATPHSASSGIASSLNSNDSTMSHSEMSSLERPSTKKKKKKKAEPPVMETAYDPNEPLVSVSVSSSATTSATTTLTENELEDIGALKKTKKKKKGKKPKIKSPFFESDAAVSKSTKSKSLKSSKSPKSKKSVKSSKSKTKIDAKTTAKLKSRPLPKTPKLKVPSKSKSSDGGSPRTPSKSPSSKGLRNAKSAKKSSKTAKSGKSLKATKSAKSSKATKSAMDTEKSKNKGKGKGKKKGSSRQLPI